MPLLWTIKQTAEQLSTSTRTVQRMLERGELPVVYIGRRAKVPAEHVKRWVEQNATLAYSSGGHGVRRMKACQEEQTETGYTSGRIAPTGGPRTSTDAAKELAKVLALPGAKKPKQS